MSSFFSSLTSVLEKWGLPWQADVDNRIVRLSISGQNAFYNLCFYIDESHRLLQLFTLVPIVIPEGCRPAIAETIARINWGLPVGRFEMHHEDGELRFQLGFLVDGDELNTKMVSSFLGASLTYVDKYISAIHGVVYANELPSDAINAVECGPR